MLELRDIVVRYGQFVALREVNLSVQAGVVHGVIGPNGAGKSTLMDVVSGRNKPQQGTVILEGRDVTSRSVQWRRRHGMARSFQRTSIFPELTVREQLQIVGRRCGQAADAERVIDVLGLGHVADQVAGRIAYGDQRRVDIGLALVGDARLLVLDEPAAGLSVEETQTLFAHLREIVDEHNLTAVVVEHDVEAVFGTCDAITVLDLGQVLMTGTAEEVRSDEQVVAAYLGSAA